MFQTEMAKDFNTHYEKEHAAEMAQTPNTPPIATGN